MSDPNLLFTMRLNKARHDRAFQGFLAPLFGEKTVAFDGGAACVGFRWRGGIYITQVARYLPGNTTGSSK